MIALLLVTSLDILPVARFALKARLDALPHDPEVWNEQVTAWTLSVLWAPHHIAGLVAAFGGVMSAQAARDAFIQTYVDDWRQIERRLQEQEASGNLQNGPDGWRLTPQGKSFMEKARLLSRLFGGDPRFVNR